MGTGRIEAFSDGVIAIIITIMVLDLKVPRGTTLSSLSTIAPQLISYALSFLVVAIIWVNHHHLLHAARHADARLLWTNINLLFWMSLIPFVTAYIGDNHRDPRAWALYGIALGLCSLAFSFLRTSIIHQHRGDAVTVRYHRRLWRRNLGAVLLYVASAGLAFVNIWISFVILVLIPLAYFLPDPKLAQVPAEPVRS